jgi:hypothetical protein
MLGLSPDQIRKDLRNFAASVGGAPGFGRSRRAQAVRSVEKGERSAVQRY